MAPVERVVSDQTVVHHDSWSEEKPPVVEEDKAADEVAVETQEDSKAEEHEEEAQEEQHNDEDLSEDEKTRDARERQINRIEAQIQAAARAVVASIEQDHYGGHEDSVLSAQTDESCDQEGSQILYDEGTELTYGDGTELTYDGTETTYEPHSEHEEETAGDSSSHHDGDIDDDDVFSRNSGHSARSSLNSIHDLSSADEVQGKELTSPTVGEEAIHSSPVPEEQVTISRIPSSASYTPCDVTPATPSKVLSRPPFRTPSSVRAIQMSSPTPSLFSSPRSSKRHLPTVSRIGTPTSFSHSPSKNRTPTRFKSKKEYPLVLLHVTVLPLTWNYSHIISSPELPASLQRVKENWRLLQDKLGDTVLERGILLPHPQDSYEILEERLLEALELPVCPRARILKCGHYMGPETPSSDEEGNATFEGGVQQDADRRWCDICGRDVRLEGVDNAGREGEKRFRIKIYASNGLMRAGAWAACWREMERVDVEIEPFLESELGTELEKFAAVTVVPKNDELHDEEEGDGFVDEENVPEGEHTHEIESHAEQEEQIGAQQEEQVRAQQEEQARAQQEEEMARHLMEEDELRRRAQEEITRHLMEEDELRRRALEEEDMRRKLQNEERMREIYGQDAPTRERSRPRPSRRSPSRSALDDDSLSELLVKAFKVAMRDKKNVVICVLSVIVLLLALRPGSGAPNHPQVIITDSVPVRDIEMNVERVPIRGPVERVAEVPVSMQEATKDIRRDRPLVEKPVSYVAEEVVVEVAKAPEKPVSYVAEEVVVEVARAPEKPANYVAEEVVVEAAKVPEKRAPVVEREVEAAVPTMDSLAPEAAVKHAQPSSDPPSDQESTPEPIGSIEQPEQIAVEESLEL